MSWGPHEYQSRLVDAGVGGGGGGCLGAVGTRGNLETFQKEAMTCSTLDMTEERWVPNSSWTLQ